MLSALSALHAGLVAASRQLGTVVIVTLSLPLLASYDLILPGASATGGNTDTLWTSASPFLQWAYLLTAAGWALSTDRAIFQTAGHFRRALRDGRFVNPQFELQTLAGQLKLSAILLAVAILQTPELLIEIGGQFGFTAAGITIGWAGAMSIGVACMGATAHAALKALEDDAVG